MSSRFLALGILVFAFIGCKPKKAFYAYPSEPEAGVTSDAIPGTPPVVADPIPEAPPLETPAPQPLPPAALPCEGTPLVIATDKLGTGFLKAQVDFNGTFQELNFMPAPKSSTLCLKGFMETAGSLLTLQILRNDKLLFIAKRANTAYHPLAIAPIIIDSCLIQPAPWDGRSDGGSCEWNVLEVPYGAN